MRRFGSATMEGVYDDAWVQACQEQYGEEDNDE